MNLTTLTSISGDVYFVTTRGLKKYLVRIRDGTLFQISRFPTSSLPRLRPNGLQGPEPDHLLQSCLQQAEEPLLSVHLSGKIKV